MTAPKPRYRFVCRDGADYLFVRSDRTFHLPAPYYRRVPIASFWWTGVVG